MPTITVKGQVTIPKAVRDHLGVGPGSEVDFLVVGDHVEVRPAAQSSAYELGKHHFGRWASGHTETSANRKRLVREASLVKRQHRPRR